MILEKSLGGYVRQKVELEGSFRINGTSTPDDIRDGNSNVIGSVARSDTGLFTVTFATVDNGGPSDLPEKLVSSRAELQSAAAFTVAAMARIVKDSYSQVTRSFQIQTIDLDTPAAADPDDNDVVTFYLAGSISGQGTD